MKSNSPPFSRAFLVDKPAGVTSHDVVAEVRREFGDGMRRRDRPKVGHTGTLDPFATGLLIVLVGKATRLQPYLQSLPKVYAATAQLGWTSTTGDPDGSLVETGRVPEDLTLPVGEVKQQVPMTSAVRVDGERLYKKAHRGEIVERPTRNVTVYRSALLWQDHDTSRAAFEIECSSGTYVRNLIETLEDAYCDELRRLKIGAVSVPESKRQEVPLSDVMSHLPQQELDGDEVPAVAQGRAVPNRSDPSSGLSLSAGGEVVLTFEGSVVAVAQSSGEKLQPRVVLV